MNKRNFFLKMFKQNLIDNEISITNIQINRPHAVLLENLPLLCIYTGDEDNNNRSGGGGNTFINSSYRNEYDIKIDIIMTDEQQVDFKLNDFAGEVEDSLHDDKFFEKTSGEDQPNNEGLKIKRTVPYTFDSEGQQSYGALSMHFAVQYITVPIKKRRLSEFNGLDGKINRLDYKNLENGNLVSVGEQLLSGGEQLVSLQILNPTLMEIEVNTNN